MESSSPRPSPRAPAGPLPDRLEALAHDRATPARELALQTCEVLRAWVREQPLEWSWAEAAEALDEGLAAWTRGQVWRGAAWRLVEVLHRARDLEVEGLLPREVLNEELSLWLLADDAPREAADEPWTGAALDAGRRLVDPTPCAERAILDGGAHVRRGETILALGFSEALYLALERAWREGLDPRVLVGRGGACADGLRLARRLSEAGLAVRVAWDADLFSRLGAADRIWVATEAVDALNFLAPLGTGALLTLARELEVPAEVVFTTDALLPGGAHVQPPEWGAREGWRLWDGAPEGVELLGQPFEPVPLSLARSVVTELGRAAPSRAGALQNNTVVPAGPRASAPGLPRAGSRGTLLSTD